MDDVSEATNEAAGGRTAGEDYAQRLTRLGDARWKRVLNVQAPYHADLRKQDLGATLDIGCGIGRLLAVLPEGSVGVDHNPHSIAIARSRGLDAYTSEAFLADPEVARPGRFDSFLAAHLVEHLEYPVALEIMRGYLPFLKPGGRILFITPQERGFASDATHITFTDWDALRRLCADLGLAVERQWSIPFPRWVGKVFTHNEFRLIARKPA
ncbi:MAG: methyltransferase domain-containing protein [Microbacteriaceae bacterium]|nr:methyltransferase domain-containing protein [Microbacteriaceae bacterium]